MTYYTVSFGGTDICERFGVVLSKFEQEPPAPKIMTVDIPAGADMDITNALGPTAFHNGVHRFVFAVTGENVYSRAHQLASFLHGKYSPYSLSWDEGYQYAGRWQATEIERLSEDAELVTVEVDRYPFKTKLESVEINSHPSGSYRLEGSMRYANVTITLRQAATVQVGSTTYSLTAGTHTLAAQIDGDATVTVTVSAWYYYVDGMDLIVNPDYYTTSGTNVTLSNPPFSVSGTNIECAGAANQTSTLTFTRKDI